MSAALLAVTFAVAGPSGAIVDGADADVDEWPWMVSLRSGGEQFCGGSIISPTTVITAAHCVEGMTADEIRVHAGTRDLDRRGQRLSVDRIIGHPDYDDDTVDSDIALLRTFGTFTYGRGVQAIDVRGPGAASAERAGTEAWATGWGALDEDEAEGYPDILQEVALTVVGDRACNRALADSGDGITNRTMLCAGGDGGDTCYGDSGGPLVARGDDRGWYLIGLTSWGIICGEPGLPSVYTQVSEFVPWIARQTPDLGGSESGPRPAPTRTVVENRTRHRLPASGTRGSVTMEIPAAGLPSTITDVNVVLYGLRHTYVSDLTILLEAPDGTLVTLLAEVGGATELGRTKLRINDEADSRLPTGSEISRGTYRPTDNASRNRPPARLSVLDGRDPNGTWKVRLIDGYDSDRGRINGVRLVIRSR